MTYLNLMTDIFLFIVVLAVYAYLYKQFSPGNQAHRIFKSIFYTIILLLAFNVVIHISYLFNTLHRLTVLFVVLSSIIVPLISVFWLFFVYSFTKCKFKSLILNIIALIILLANLGFSIFSIIPGYNLYFDFSETYPQIGPYFFIYGIFTLIPFVISLIIILAQWRSIKPANHPEIMFLINFLPFMGIVSQTIIGDFTILITSLILTFIITALGLQHLFAVTDYLTGLYNRRQLIQKLNEKIKRMNKDTCIGGYMIDLDNFKALNDEKGHNAGDAALREFADILLNLMNKGDFVSRFGGDEFVVIRPLKDPSELKDYKHQLIEAIKEYNALPTTAVPITLSIGCHAFCKGQNCIAEEFLEIIDDAMYENKKERKLIEQTSSECADK